MNCRPNAVHFNGAFVGLAPSEETLVRGTQERMTISKLSLAGRVVIETTYFGSKPNTLTIMLTPYFYCFVLCHIKLSCIEATTLAGRPSPHSVSHTADYSAQTSLRLYMHRNQMHIGGKCKA